jgi:dTDP-4-dehydrorhamnose reductase
MKILVVGASGQLGQEFFKLRTRHELVALAHADVEVEAPESVQAVMERHRPQVVVNLASYNKVDEAEDRPERALGVNALGAFHVARAAARVDAAVVFISTDYVFGEDGGRQRPYGESDAPGPIGVYGVSKLAGEHLVRMANPRHFIIRTCGLYGVVTSHKGWTFPELMLKKAQAGEKLRVVQNQVLTPTYTFDLVRAILAVVEKDQPGLYHLTSAGACSWYEFARATLELAGVKAEIEPVSAESFAARARRPAYSVLANERLASLGLEKLRPWPEALKAYFLEKGVIR